MTTTTKEDNNNLSSKQSLISEEEEEEALEETLLSPDKIPAAKQIEIGMLIKVIEKLEHKQEQYRALRQEAIDFYENKITSLEKRKEFIQGMIMAYMRYHSLNHLDTPIGTAVIRKHTTNEWPDRAVVIEFARKHQIPVKVVETVDLRDVVKFLKDHPEEHIPGLKQSVREVLVTYSRKKVQKHETGAEEKLD